MSSFFSKFILIRKLKYFYVDFESLSKIETVIEKDCFNHPMRGRKKSNKKLIFLYGILVCSCCYFFGWIWIKSPEEYREDYQLLKQKLLPDSAKQINREAFIAMQNRVGVVKNVYSEGDQGLCMQIYSKKSDLMYDYQEGRIQVIEKLSGVQCSMQEELYYLTHDGLEVIENESGKYSIRNKKKSFDKDSSILEMHLDKKDLIPMQKICLIKAESAICLMTEDSITAYDAQVNSMQLPGHSLPPFTELHGKQMLTSYADEIHVMFGDKGLNFSLKGLKGQMSILRK